MNITLAKGVDGRQLIQKLHNFSQKGTLLLEVGSG